MESIIGDLEGEDSRSSAESSEGFSFATAMDLRKNLTPTFDKQFDESSSSTENQSSSVFSSVSERINQFEQTPGDVVSKPPMIPNRRTAKNLIPSDRFAVYLRIRPPSSYDKNKNKAHSSNTIEILQPANPQMCPTKVRTYPPADSQASKFNINLDGHGATSSAREFEFHQVLSQNTTQQELYTVVAAPLIHSLFQDSASTEKSKRNKMNSQKSALLFSYGITNAGKTHTILGNTKSNDSAKWGVIPRAISDIFNRMNVRSNTTPSNGGFELYISCFEVYNEQIFDLLPTKAKASTKRIGPPPTLKVRESRGQILVRGLTKHKVKNINHGIDLTKMANNKRHTSSNNLNAGSSRSHFICQMQILPLSTQSEDISVDSLSGYSTDEEASITKSKNISTLWIVDLAGSERSKRTGMGSSRQKEASLINKSLLTLMRCLTVMRESGRQNSASIIPFRESKLTHLFMGHLTSSSASRTSMIVNVNPAIADFDETQHVLAYASKAKTIQVKPEELYKKRKQYFGDEYDMNGRKKTKIAPGKDKEKGLFSRTGLSPKKIARKFSPKKLFGGKSKDQASHSRVKEQERNPHNQTASIPCVSSQDHEIKKLSVALTTAKLEIEKLRMENSHLIEDLENQERQIRMEVSEEIEERLKLTRARNIQEMERLKAKMQSNPHLARSGRKAQTDMAETQIQDLMDKVDECEEEMARLQKEHAAEISGYKSRIQQLEKGRVTFAVDDNSTKRIKQLEKELAASKAQVSYLEKSKTELIENYENLLNENECDSEVEDEDNDSENTASLSRKPRKPLGNKMCALNKGQDVFTGKQKRLAKESSTRSRIGSNHNSQTN